MKKNIFLNILITLALFPYVMVRWIHFPYSEGVLSLETVMVYGTFLMGAGLSLSNIMLLLSLRWTKYKPFFLKATMIFMSFLFAYPIYAGIQTGYDNGGLWIDFIALGVLYLNLWLSNRAFQTLKKRGNVKLKEL